MDYLNRTMLHGNLETLILALLAKGDSYAYRLRWDLADRSHNAFQPALGRLYPLLRSMERRRLVRAFWKKGRGDQERRYYSMTPKGRHELAERKYRWRRFAERMALVLNPT